jgi:hypothetical protein
MTQIIDLKQYRRSLIRCEATGLAFPKIYRRRGVVWDHKPGANPNSLDDLIPGNIPVVEYTLSIDESDHSIANPAWDEIAHPSAGLDSGWIILRHHKSRDEVKGYINGLYDMQTVWRPDRMVYQTEAGLFTITQRDPLPGRPAPLIAWATTVPHPRFGEDDWVKVLGADGAEHAAEVLHSDDGA